MARRITKLVQKGELKVELAPQHEVDEFDSEIDEVLQLIGVAEYLITDMSSLSDFPHDEEDLKKLRDYFGVPIDRKDLLADIGARIRAKRTP